MTAFKIGVDGGGTKTEFILVDAAGAIVARHVSSGCNPSQVGPERAAEIFRTGLEALLQESGIENVRAKIAATQLYMAGSPAFWREFANGLKDCGVVTTGPDSLPVLELATGGAPGLALHAGTGSFVVARAPDGAIHYAGGLGWKFGDAGSGFDLGRRAIAAALLELQSLSCSRGDPAAVSPLAAALRAHTGLIDYASHSRFFYNDAGANAAIARFAPRVLELAEGGNDDARRIVTETVADLANLADQVIRRHFAAAATRVPCGISGHLLNAAPAASTLRTLAAERRWPVDLRFITESPAEGVRRLLCKS